MSRPTVATTRTNSKARNVHSPLMAYGTDGAEGGSGGGSGSGGGGRGGFGREGLGGGGSAIALQAAGNRTVARRR